MQDVGSRRRALWKNRDRRSGYGVAMAVAFASPLSQARIPGDPLEKALAKIIDSSYLVISKQRLYREPFVVFPGGTYKAGREIHTGSIPRSPPLRRRHYLPRYTTYTTDTYPNYVREGFSYAENGTLAWDYLVSSMRLIPKSRRSFRGLR